MISDTYRHIRSREKDIMLHMISGGEDWVIKLRQQLDGSMVKAIDSYGSLKFDTNCAKCTILCDGPLITATHADSDTIEGFGPYVNFILFIKDGFIDELQIYKDDGSPIKTEINPLSLLVEIDRSRLVANLR